MLPIDGMDQLNYATSYDQYFHQDLMNCDTPTEFDERYMNWDVVTSPSPTSYNLILPINNSDRNTHIVPNVMYNQTECQLDQNNFVLESGTQFSDSGSSGNTYADNEFAAFCYSNYPSPSQSVLVEQAPSSLNIQNLDSLNMYLSPDVSQQCKLPPIDTLRRYMPTMRRYQYSNDSASIKPAPETTSDSPISESLVPPAIHTARVSKQRNYKCTTCNGYFYQKWHLKRHYQTKKHKDQVIFSGKAFITKGQLKTHYKAVTHKDKLKISGKPDPATLVTGFRSIRSNRYKQASLSNSSQETPSSNESQTQSPPILESNNFSVNESNYFSYLTPFDGPKSDFSQATFFSNESETQPLISHSNHFSHLPVIDGLCTARSSVINYPNEQANLNSFSQAAVFANGSEFHSPPTLQYSDFSHMIPFEPSTARSSGLFYPNEQMGHSDFSQATATSLIETNLTIVPRPHNSDKTGLRSIRSNRYKQASLSYSSQETPSSNESQTQSLPILESNDFSVDEESTARSSELADLSNFFQATVFPKESQTHSPSILESNYFSYLTPFDGPKSDFSQATFFSNESETQPLIAHSNHFSHLPVIDGLCTARSSVINYPNERADLNSFSQAAVFSNGKETHSPPTLQSSDFTHMIPFEPSTARSSGLIYLNEQAVHSDFSQATVSENQFQELTASKQVKGEGAGVQGSVSTSSPTISTIKRKQSIFYCIPCDRSFEKSGYFTQHNNAMHSEKPHKCSKCGKRFKLLIERDEHEAIHVGTKPFHCDSCDRQFYYRTDLRKHEFSHTGQMPHVCEFCKRGFIRKGHFITHQRRCKMIPASAVQQLKKQF